MRPPLLLRHEAVQPMQLIQCRPGCQERLECSPSASPARRRWPCCLLTKRSPPLLATSWVMLSWTSASDVAICLRSGNRQSVRQRRSVRASGGNQQGVMRSPKGKVASGGRCARRCAPDYHINGQGAETRIIISRHAWNHDVLTDQRTAEKIWRNLPD
jgi:hypothetical protein